MKILILCLITLPLLPSCVTLRTDYGTVTFEPRLPVHSGGKTPVLFQK